MGIPNLIIMARFPIILWKDRMYLEKGEIDKAEKLYDRAAERFSGSTKLEREYLEKFQSLSLALDVAEHNRSIVTKPIVEKQEAVKPQRVTPVAVKKEQPIIISKPQKTTSLKTMVPSVNYGEMLNDYRRLFARYIASSPEQRAALEPKINELKERLLRIGLLKNEEDV